MQITINLTAVLMTLIICITICVISKSSREEEKVEKKKRQEPELRNWEYPREVTPKK